MKAPLFLLCLAMFVAGCSSDSKGPGATPPVGGPSASSAPPVTVAFTDVQAILRNNCVGCHGQSGDGGIDIRTFESLMKGGEPGPIVKPGDAAGSLIVHALRETGSIKRMPFNRAPLAEEDIAKVEAWIDAGAKG